MLQGAVPSPWAVPTAASLRQAPHVHRCVVTHVSHSARHEKTCMLSGTRTACSFSAEGGASRWKSELGTGRCELDVFTRARQSSN